MGPRLRFTLAIALLALPLSAAQRRQSFQVGAVVVRSAVVHALVSASGAARLRLTGAPALTVQIDSTPVQAVAGAAEVAVPPGTILVTIQY